VRLGTSPGLNGGLLGRELEAAIDAYIDALDAEPKPFSSARSADAILAAVTRFCQRTVGVPANCPETSDSGH
jgi:hypothetical protein